MQLGKDVRAFGNTHKGVNLGLVIAQKKILIKMAFAVLSFIDMLLLIYLLPHVWSSVQVKMTSNCTFLSLLHTSEHKIITYIYTLSSSVSDLRTLGRVKRLTYDLKQISKLCNKKSARFIHLCAVMYRRERLN